jgi:hypothetical protein
LTTKPLLWCRRSGKAVVAVPPVLSSWQSLISHRSLVGLVALVHAATTKSGLTTRGLPDARHSSIRLLVALAVHIILGQAELGRHLPGPLACDTVRIAIAGLLRRQNNAIVVLGVLEIIFRHHAIA